MFGRIGRILGGGDLTPSSSSDDVFPVHATDYAYRGSIINWLMRFNDVLDPDTLHSSLSQLLEIGDWRKLGGRLRADKAGTYALHVPKTFTPERPAVAYTKEALKIDIEQHPWGSQLPTPTDEPSVQYTMNHLTSFWENTKVPAKFKDYLEGDRSQLALHVTTFRNATLVAVSFPHTTSDIMGAQAIVKAWGLVLAGRADEVPPFLGAREDLTKPLWESGPDEPFLLQPMLMQGWQLVRYLFGFVKQILRQPQVDTRVLCLPASFVASLRERALADLGGGDAFVSENDVLCAWLARLVVAARKGSRSAPLTVGSTADIRGRLPAVFDPAKGAYVQNLVSVSFASFSKRDESDGQGSWRSIFGGTRSKRLFSGLSLGAAAARIRQALREQLAEAETRATFRAMIRYSQKKKRLALFGEPAATPMIVTNWTKAQFMETTVDFGPAVVQAGDTSPGRRNLPGRMLYLLGGSLELPMAARNFFIINGRDCAGNYWVSAYMAKDAFDVIQDLLRGGPSSWLDPLGPNLAGLSARERKEK